MENTMDLSKKRIILTGGNGFLGKHVAKILAEKDCEVSVLAKDHLKRPGVFIIRSSDFDLTKNEDVKEVFKLTNPDIVIHLAAVVGGIGINSEKPGTFFYKNLMMGTQLIERSRIYEVEKFVAIGTICAYPKFTEVPFKEEDLWNGYPEETNAAYGLAKKMMLVQAQAYRQEFGTNIIYLLPVNLYGPHDNFDPSSSHVIPALIKKCIDAKLQNLDHITCWGTGQASREFLYVEDAANGIVTATEKYNGEEPVNLGAGREIYIKDLVHTIADLCGFKGEIRWDSSKPDGQPRRCLDTSKALQEFGWKANTSFEDGLRKTIEWYENAVTN